MNKNGVTMFNKFCIFLCFTSLSWPVSIGFSFGKANESPDQILNQSLFSNASNQWLQQQTIVPEPSDQRQVHVLFNTQNQATMEQEVAEESHFEDANLSLNSLHNMFKESPRYVQNI